MSADPTAAIMAFLNSESNVSSLVFGRIFGGELPREEVEQMPRPAIVVQASGGAGNSNDYVDITRQRFDVFCYEKTLRLAENLRREVYLSLKQMRRQVQADTVLFSVNDAGGFFTMRDPDAGWPIAWQSFQLLYGDVEVSV